MKSCVYCIFLVSLLVGCSNESSDNERIITRNIGNTWTSDMLQNGNILAIQKKVQNDPNYIHERDYVGDTPLLTAISFDMLELVEFLLQHNSNPNIEVDDGYTCILSAIESESSESIDIVNELIKAGADIHAVGINGWTPLHMAAAQGQVEKATLLINAGADVNRRTEIDGYETPLMEAAHSGHASTVRLLLASGADSSMRDAVNNQTPLEIAKTIAKGPDPEVVKCLKREGFKIDGDELLSEMDFSNDEIKFMKQEVENLDMAQMYIDSINELVKNGDHAEVIRILTEAGD